MVEFEVGNGFPSPPDTAAGCVGFTYRRLVCGPPSEYILQLLPPLPVDISPGLPFPPVYGKALSFVFSTKKKGGCLVTKTRLLLFLFNTFLVSH